MMELQGINRVLAELPEDSMNGHEPTTLYVDTGSGSFGSAKQLVLIDVTQWSDDDYDAWHEMTDCMRMAYGEDMLRADGQMVTPTQYAEQYATRYEYGVK
jgi:hypothetical protein